CARWITTLVAPGYFDFW
nr:immunoglobulin heavy chain junction region [Mus musculus]